MPTPVLTTERLVLDGLREGDADALTRLAGMREIADTTISIPHPYERADAERYLRALEEAGEGGDSLTLAIRLRDDPLLVGSVGLKEIDRTHLQAELGYWIGVPYWGRGYATEAARAVVQYGFDTLGLNRIYAHHMTRNPVSGRILERIGMQREGVLRERVRKWGQFEDVVMYAVLKSDKTSAPR